MAQHLLTNKDPPLLPVKCIRISSQISSQRVSQSHFQSRYAFLVSAKESLQILHSYKPYTHHITMHKLAMLIRKPSVNHRPSTLTNDISSYKIFDNHKTYIVIKQN